MLGARGRRRQSGEAARSPPAYRETTGIMRWARFDRDNESLHAHRDLNHHREPNPDPMTLPALTHQPETRLRLSALLLALLTSTVLALTACGGESTATKPFTTVDSAGITIVESAQPLWGEGEAWRIADEPEVVIGAVDGDERYLLSRVYGARRFPDGRIAILDAGSSRVRVYDRQGGHLVDMGGPGDGPSEFSFAQYLGLVGDTIVVFDGYPPTLTWFSGDGAFLRTALLPAAQTGRRIVSALTFGFLNGNEGVMAAVSIDRPWLKPGRAREEMTIWRYDLSAAGIDSLATIRTDEIVVRVSDGRPGWNRLTFGKTTYFAASKDWIYLAPNDAYSIAALDREGVTRRIIRRIVEPRGTTEEDVARALRQVLRLQMLPPDEVEPLVARMRDQPRADFMPAYHMVVADTENNLWVEDFDDVGVDQGNFSVFRSDGAWLGRIELPPGLPRQRGRPIMSTMLEIGADYILGVWIAELGVEQVRLYRIEKPKATSRPSG